MKNRKKFLCSLLAVISALTISVAFPACEGLPDSLGSIFGTETPDNGDGGETEDPGNGEGKGEGETPVEPDNGDGGETDAPDPIPPGHTCVWGEWTEVGEATCVAEGQEKRVCTLDSTHTETRSIPVDADNHDIYRGSEEATHTMMGWSYESCENGCGYYVSGDDTPVIHDGYLQYVNSQDPTCTEDGWYGYYECTYEGCQYSYYEENKRPATGHSEVNHSAKEATCVEDGWKAYITCRNCDYSTYEENKIAAFRHDFTNGNCSKCQMPKPSEGLRMTLQNDDTYMVSGIGSCTDTRIVIPDYYNEKPVTAIGDSAFTRNNSLIGVVIGDLVKSIGRSAFYLCTKLLSVQIGKSVDSIGDMAFIDCRRLVEVYNRSSLNIVAGEDFRYDLYSSTGLGAYAKIVYTAPYESKVHISDDYIVYVDDGLVSLIGYDGNQTTLEIPSVFTEINEYAFRASDNLVKVVIPDSVTSIGEGAFYACTNLADITVSNSLVFIANNIFKYTAIQKATMPAKAIGSIPKDNLKQATITSGDLPVNAFKDCTTLKTVLLPNDLTSIPSSAFSGCTSLSTINIPSTVNGIGSFAFSGCRSLTNIVIPQGVTFIAGGAFIDCDGLTSIIIPNNVTSIGEYALSCCDALTSVTLGTAVSTIEDRAFEGTENIVRVSYKGDINAWCNISFADYISNPLWNGASLYIDGQQVTEVVITDTEITEIKSYAFQGCVGLVRVVLPEGVTKIGYNAFSNADLREIEIPKSVVTIDTGFDSSKTVIYYKGTSAEWNQIEINRYANVAYVTKYYYSESEPALNEDGTAYAGKYWRYVGGIATPWVYER